MKDSPKISVRVVHEYAASAERVFDAWLDPSRAATFLFATDTGTVVRCDIDARVGGGFVIVDRRPRDGDVEHVGTYVVIDRPRRLVFDFAVPQFAKDVTRVSIDIAPRGSGCVLTLTHDGVFEDYRERTEGGWTTILAALDRAM